MEEGKEARGRGRRKGGKEERRRAAKEGNEQGRKEGMDEEERREASSMIFLPLLRCLHASSNYVV